MGIANNYSRVIRRHLETHAAWLPVTNTFALGDFGVISGGVFTRMGNAADLGVSWKEREGPPSTLDYSSSSVTTVRLQGGGAVEAFSGGDVNAKLQFQFKRGSTFVLKAAEVRSTEIDDVFQVAASLAAHGAWRRRYRFVRTLYVAKDALILASRESGTTASLQGSADLLAQVDAGKISTELGLVVDKELALEIRGQSGVIGLGLAKIAWRGGVKAAGVEAQANEVGIVEDSDWDEDPEDDI